VTRERERERERERTSKKREERRTGFLYVQGRRKGRRKRRGEKVDGTAQKREHHAGC